MADEEIVDDQSGASDNAGATGQDNADGAGDKTADDTSKDKDGGENEADDELDLESLEPETRTKEEIAADKENEDKDDDVDDEDLKTIDQRIKKQLSPLQAQIQKQNDEIEVNTFLQANPELSKYKPVMLKYVSHPAYKNVPVSAIAAIVSSKDQQRIGASKERAAAKKVKESRGGGSQARSNDSAGGKDVWAMSKAEFEAHIASGIASARK